MKNWIKGTFSDSNGWSFKRQSAFILVLACILGVFKGADITPLALLAGTILGFTEVKNIGGKK